MKNHALIIGGILLVFALGFFTSHLFNCSSCKSDPITIKSDEKKGEKSNQINKTSMKLGAFSISLSVKDLKTSREFYENLGFTVLGGNMESNYLIMKNENALIGLFQGMFEGNILTFNPGWDENGENIDSFEDIREIQKHLKEKKIALTLEADENSTGPTSLMTTDPDGNMILIDQHR